MTILPRGRLTSNFLRLKSVVSGCDVTEKKETILEFFLFFITRREGKPLLRHSSFSYRRGAERGETALTSCRTVVK